MADLLDILRAGIALADSITKTNRLQASIGHRSASASGGSGDVTLGEVIPRDALVEWKVQEVRGKEGEATLSKATVTFLDPSVVITFEDVIILPDGTTGPIVGMEGFVDRVTTRPVLTQVYLG